MKAMWSLSTDDYFEIVRRSKEKGLKPGDSMEEVLIEYMKEKGRKPIGHTELNEEELLADTVIKSKKGVLHQQVDKNGKTTYRVIKKRGESNDS